MFKFFFTEKDCVFHNIRAVLKWPSKVIRWLRLLRLVIGLKESRQFFSQWDAKPKPIAPCTRDFSRASSQLQVIPRNCDWFIALFVPVVIGRSNCFGYGFSTVIWKPLHWKWLRKQKNRMNEFGPKFMILTFSGLAVWRLFAGNPQAFGRAGSDSWFVFNRGVHVSWIWPEKELEGRVRIQWSGDIQIRDWSLLVNWFIRNVESCQSSPKFGFSTITWKQQKYRVNALSNDRTTFQDAFFLDSK